MHTRIGHSTGLVELAALDFTWVILLRGRSFASEAWLSWKSMLAEKSRFVVILLGFADFS